ncbi:MAG TPA: cupin domain-containing protein [Pseudonocardia sp.]|jgi:mannose-6-phosphate isomerase-like protein (cupin superfamily)|uniref:cupin domain-containing protein n=1 Tax=Pseudonocardia sp. TaxID=60912 RepID=UPI002ED945EF
MSELSAATEFVADYVLGQELRVRILTTAEETDGQFDLTDQVMPVGGMTALHLHARYEERIWVVSGSFDLWAASEHVTLRPGDFYTIGLNVPHAIHAGPDGGRALTLSSPAGFGKVIARTATPVELASPDTELNTELFMAVTEELGDVILGPPGAVPADLGRAEAGSSGATSPRRR